MTLGLDPEGRSDLRRKRTVDRNIRSIHLRAFLLIRFFRRLLKLLQLLFFLFLLAHVNRSLSFNGWIPPTILTVQT
jgi:hypothetical protein